MPGEHAVLSPSSAERWIICPASVQASAEVPRGPESPYAQEGTIAHELAELKALFHFGKIQTDQYRHRRAFWRKRHADVLNQDDIETEMERHTEAYVSLIQEQSELYPDSQVLFEQRLPTGMPDGGSGTSDAVIVSPRHVAIVDFKYGQGVAVEAAGNPQLRLYALGALDTFGDVLGDTEIVIMTVHQPRLNHVLTDKMAPDALRAWRADTVVPAAEEALGPEPHFQPSEAGCRWCPVSGRCRAQLEWVFSEPFDLPAVLLPDEVATTLARLPQVRQWLKAFEETALTMAYSEGTSIPGYKVVMSGGKRSLSNEAIDYLVEHGYAPEEVSKTTARGIGELTQLMGDEKFAELCAPYLTKSEGRPSLVPESDKRPAVAPNSEAQKEEWE
jgi:hypothetical protein